MNRKVIAATMMAACLPMSASAVDLTFNGFMTVGGGMTLRDDETYAGYDHKPGFDADTRFGLQADVVLTDQVSVTGQLLARGEDEYDIEAEWAYVTYKFNDQLQGRMGRIRTPFFMYSDYLDVGYAYHWNRVPEDVYGSTDFLTSLEGVDFIYNANLLGWHTSTQVYYGRESGEMDVNGEPADRDLTNFGGVALTGTMDWLTLRAAVHTIDLTISNESLDELTAGLIAFGYANEAEAFDFSEDNMTFVTLGAGVDFERWFGKAEYVTADNEDTLVPDNSSWYVSGGMRFGKLTVHSTYSNAKSDALTGLGDSIVIPPSPPTPPGVVAALTGMKTALSHMNSARTEKSSVNVGTRWELAANTAFKVDYTRVNPTGDGTFGMVSVGVDVVF